MTIKIRAPRCAASTWDFDESAPASGVAARLVRESTWRKVMAVVNTAAAATDGLCLREEVDGPVAALRKHLEKRK